ncbi:MAG: CHAT domain-containing protein [Candidatus Omnitrophica bacterium]|nr:CHAT domain-containing protein [Candidatus Omnitrophota bacterium]
MNQFFLLLKNRHLNVIVLGAMICIYPSAGNVEAAKDIQGYRIFSSPSSDPQVYDQDIRIAKRILREAEKNFFDDIRIAPAMINLALLYEKGGHIELALPHYENALTILENQEGYKSPQVLDLSDRVARIYKMMGRIAQAMKLSYDMQYEYEQDLALAQEILVKQEKNLGVEHHKVVRLFELVGSFHRTTGKVQEAIKLYEKVYQSVLSKYGETHPRLALIAEQLGYLYRRVDNYPKARETWHQALKVWEKHLGANSPKVAEALINLSYIFIDFKQNMVAAALSRKAQEIHRETLKNILSFGSEEQRLDHMETVDPYSLPATLNDTPALVQAIFDHKGIVLDSIIEDIQLTRQARGEKNTRLLKSRSQKKKKLMKLYWDLSLDMTREDRYKKEQRKNRLKYEIKEIEQQMTQHMRFGQSRGNYNVDMQKIQEALPDDSTLIDFIRYNHYLGHYKFEKRYGAVVIGPEGPPRWVPLGQASVIDAAIKRYQVVVRQDNYFDNLTAVLLNGLYGMIWEPLETSLTQRTRRVIISAAGSLNYLSFATLLTPNDRFLAQKYRIYYVPYSRDILKKTPVGQKKDIFIFADPAFARDTERKGVPFYPLPGSRDEAQSIDKIARNNQYASRLYLQDQASEASLNSLSSPRILHLATHGFFQKNGNNILKGVDRENLFLLDSDRSGAMPTFFQSLKNPMQTSGLALVGAQDSVDIIAGESIPLTANDGIVTAEEISLLDLQRTWLVVLSVCDSGLVDIVSGDEFMGLRRGFMQAGAQNVMLSLWRVDDRVTPRFMKDYYARLFKMQSPARSLSFTQRSWLVQLRNQRGLHYAVKHAGSFILLSQGPLD